MYNIAIRADGGPAVGMGHIMRCLAVAEELVNLGCRVYFISKYQQGIEKIRCMGFEAFGISKESNEIITAAQDFNYGTEAELADDLDKTYSIIREQGCQLLLVDKYNLTSEYFDSLKDFVSKVAFIDDLNSMDCSADVIINGNINATSLGYRKLFQDQRLFLGTAFTLLRNEFRMVSKREVRKLANGEDMTTEIKHQSNEKSYPVPEIMITTGGADPYNCTGKFLEILLGHQRTAGMIYNVVITSGFIHRDKIQVIAEKNSNVNLYVNINCISEIMLRSDLAISSGGSTLYELCCCGTPTLAFVMADNQNGIVETLAEDEYIQSLGWYNQIESSQITQKVVQLVNNFKLRKNYSSNMQRLIDGNGAERIAQEIIDIIKN